jgi:hypothetical protein
MRVDRARFRLVPLAAAGPKARLEGPLKDQRVRLLSCELGQAALRSSTSSESWNRDRWLRSSS